MRYQLALLTTFVLIAAGCDSTRSRPTAATDLSQKSNARAGSTAAKEILSNPLDPKERVNWHIERGGWKFGTNALTGSGDSSIQYFRTVSSPFQVKFDIEVIDGMRPRLQFDRFTFANEGYSHTFGLFPERADSKRYPYAVGQTYGVQIDVTSTNIEIRVDGKLIESRDAGLERIWQLRFSGGDNWSKGTTRFSNISIRGSE